MSNAKHAIELVESIIEVSRDSEKVGRIKEASRLLSALKSVMTEVMESDLSPTRKGASLQALHRLLDVYNESFDSKEGE